MNKPLLETDDVDEGESECNAQEMEFPGDQKKSAPALRKDHRASPPVSGPSRREKDRQDGMNMPLRTPDIGDPDKPQCNAQKVEFPGDQKESAPALRKDHRASPPVSGPSRREKDRQDGMNMPLWANKTQALPETIAKSPNFTRIVLEQSEEVFDPFGLLKDFACHKENETERKDSGLWEEEWATRDQSQVERKTRFPDIVRILSVQSEEACDPFGLLIKDSTCHEDNERERENSVVSEKFKDQTLDAFGMIRDWATEDQAQVDTEPKSPDFTRTVKEQYKEPSYSFGLLKDAAYHDENEMDTETKERSTSPLRKSDSAKFMQELLAKSPGSAGIESHVESDPEKKETVEELMDSVAIERLVQVETELQKSVEELKDAVHIVVVQKEVVMTERNTSPVMESDSERVIEELLEKSTGAIGAEEHVQGGPELQESAEELTDSIDIVVVQEKVVTRERDTSPVMESDSERVIEELLEKSTGAVGVEGHFQGYPELQESTEELTDSIDIVVVQEEVVTRERDTSPVMESDSERVMDELLEKSRGAVGVEGQVQGDPKLQESVEEITDSVHIVVVQEEAEMTERDTSPVVECDSARVREELPGTSTGSVVIQVQDTGDPEMKEEETSTRKSDSQKLQEELLPAKSMGSDEIAALDMEEEEPKLTERDQPVREKNSVKCKGRFMEKSKKTSREQLSIKLKRKLEEKAKEAALPEINAMIRFKDNYLSLELLSYSSRRSLSLENSEKYRMLIGYFDRDPLSRYRSKFFTNQVLQRIFYQVGEALKYMHGKNVIHQRIRPEAILINKYLDVKLSDFRLASFGPITVGSCRYHTSYSSMDAPECIKETKNFYRPHSYEIDYRTTGATLYYLNMVPFPSSRSLETKNLYESGISHRSVDPQLPVGAPVREHPPQRRWIGAF